MLFKDPLNRTIEITRTPQRIISLVPSLTELLVDLGLENNLIGITKFCIYPKQLLKTKTIVGGTKQIHLDRIKYLKPDFILCNKEENTQKIVAEVAQVAATYVSDIYTIKDTLELIKELGIILDCKQQATIIRKQIEEERNKFLEYIKNKTQKKVVYFIWANPYMVVGGNNFINEMLTLNKFKNIYATSNRYPEINLAELKETDYVLLSSEPFPFKTKHKELFIKHTKAKIILVEGEPFSWYGSRLIKAFEYFKKLHISLE